ncbi:MAG: hypothetical protein LC737_04900 [Chloroflexi bacterium]|nr:hypothetical protein [Chloroflexota bacterium]
MNSQPTFNFRWRSLLGVSVALFLLYGALNVFLPIYVPYTLHTNGAWSGGGLVLTNEADLALLGSFAETAQRDVRVGAFLVSFMDTMCAFMMAFALLQMAIVWFALRAGQRWALFAVALSDVAIIPYFIAITQTYARFGVAGADDFMRGMWILAALILAATALGWFGLRRAQRAASVAP